MINTEIIAKHIKNTKIELEEIEGRCTICSKQVNKTIKRNKVLSEKFTDNDYLLNISSDRVCEDCAICVKTRELRTHNILADEDNLYLFKKADIEEYLFNLEKYVNPPFVFAITRSFKKHNSFKTKVNYSTKKIYIQEEDERYILDIEEAKSLYQDIYKIYMYFTKDEILTGNYAINRLLDLDIEEFRRIESQIAKVRGSNQLSLLVYMLDSEKRQAFIDKRKEKKKKEKEKKKDTQLKLF